MKKCKTCELVAWRDTGKVPLWDCIQRTEYWDVAHCYETALPGWIVLVARRHVASISELSEAEATEMGLLMRNISAALKDVTGCLKTYVLQFAEAPEHQHVHFHIIPRMADQPENRRSTRIFGYLGVPEEERVSQAAMNEVAQKIQAVLRTYP